MRRYVTRRAGRGRFETWQIIYIDLMTNVMIFFVILWAISQRADKGVSETIGTETVKMVNLPGDVLFPPGKAEVSEAGRSVFEKLFSDPTGSVLSFDTGGLVKRLLVIHGHTDGDGAKDENFELGYQRAVSTYREIRRYGEEVPDHVVLCSHADNTPVQEVPAFGSVLSLTETNAVKEAKTKNRRISIDDKMVSRMVEGSGP